MNIQQLFNSPIANFTYGCIWFFIGLSYWQTPILNNLLIENNFSPLIGLMITGIHLMIGYVLISSNYLYIIDSDYRKQYKKDMIELENDRIKFNKMMQHSNKSGIKDA